MKWIFTLPIVALITSAWNEQWQWHVNYTAAKGLFKQSMAAQQRDRD